MFLKQLFNKFLKTTPKPKTDSNLVQILLVDDIKSNILIAKALFEKRIPNISCDFAMDGRDAVLKVKNNKYSFILMDVQMPVMNGFDATREIREFDLKTPIITYSSRATKSMLDSALDAGMSGYLVKPISNQLLLRTLSKWSLRNQYQDPKFTDQNNLSKILKGKRILFADDIESERHQISKTLENQGMIVDVAKDGQELLDLFYEKESQIPYYYDLVLTDVKMPIKSGSDVAHEIREYQYRRNEDNITKNTPIIAITGENIQTELNGLLKSKIDDYFIKGEKINNLISQIAFWIDYHEQALSISKSPTQYHKVITTNDDYGQYQILDRSRLSNLKNEDVKEILDMFIDNSQHLIEKIKRAADDNKVDEAFVHSHSLKGSSGNVGADRLHRYLIYINESTRSKAWPQEEHWEERLDEFFRITKEEVEK